MGGWMDGWIVCKLKGKLNAKLPYFRYTCVVFFMVFVGPHSMGWDRAFTCIRTVLSFTKTCISLRHCPLLNPSRPCPCPRTALLFREAAPQSNDDHGGW